MSYYYRRRYSYKRNYSRTSGTNPQVERRPRKSFDITAYIKKEFFNADDLIFTKVASLYRQLYGDGAYKYMMETFYSWKSGSVGLSEQTMRRILECVPKFLSDEKRFYILKCEMIYFIETLHLKQQNKKTSLSQINDLFESYAKEIENFNQVNLSWFVGKGIFTETEIQQFLDVCKYALNKKLNLSFRQVQSDLTLIKSKLSDLKQGSFHASYQIDFLTSTVELSNINQTTLNFKQLTKHEIIPEGTFKQFAEQYILEELIKMDFSEYEGGFNSNVKSNDLDFFISQYKEILDRDNEVSLKSEFKGEGGQLNLSLDIKSLKKIQASLFISGGKLTLYVAISVFAIFLIFAIQLHKEFTLLFFGGLIIGGMLYRGIITEIETMKNLKLDLKRYGK
jgi:hypothetical protein